MQSRHWGVILLMAASAALLNTLPAQQAPPGMRLTQDRESPEQVREYLNRLILSDEDPMTGTWILVISKSKFQPGPALKSSRMLTEVRRNSFKCVLNPVDASGHVRHGEWTANLDGKDYPALMAPFADSIALTRIDPDTIEAVYKKDGKATSNERLIFSRDRHTVVVLQEEITTTGQGYKNILVYDKE
jgi:hypothetical protein